MASDHPSGHDHDDQHGDFHVVPIRYLVVTGLALVVLTVITVAARYVDFDSFGFPDLNIFVAMGIAVIKASLVCLFFMHLFWDRQVNGIILVTSLAFAGLMISFTILDSGQYQPAIRAYDNAVLSGYEMEVTQSPEVKVVKDALKTLPERMNERLGHDADHDDAGQGDAAPADDHAADPPAGTP